MNPFLPAWSMERITLLAPDAASAQSGRELANPQLTAWQAIASDSYSAWAVYQEHNKSPYKVKVDLLKLRHDDKVWDCNCRTYKSPCKHIIALLYMLINDPQHITEAHPPHWVEEWLDKEAISARKRDERKQKNDTITPERIAQRQKLFTKRKLKIANGLQELEQWLINMIRRGLADPQVRRYDFWDSRAARMVDAQAPGVANWIRDMGSIPSKSTDWIEPLLEQLGRLYLLIESFKNYDKLPEETQADIRSVLGWHIKRDEMVFYDTLTVTDTWLVIGRYTGDVVDDSQKNGRRGLKTQRVWLRGLETGQNALILEFTFGDSAFETIRQIGTSFTGELCFYPSQYPLRAFIAELHNDNSYHETIIGRSIKDSIEQYALALAKNPWVIQYPFVLEDVIPVQLDHQWVLREVDGTYLPLSEAFEHTWSLLALSGGYPIQVTGEWDGKTLYPIGAMVDKRYVDFNVIGKFHGA